MIWNTYFPPPEWKPGMLLLVEGGHYEPGESQWGSKLSVEVIGSCVLVHAGYGREGRMPGTEHDGEGLGIDRWVWRGVAGRRERFEVAIRGWHPGVSSKLEEIPEVKL